MLFKNIILFSAASAVAVQINGSGTDKETHHIERADNTTGKVAPAGKFNDAEKANANAENAEFQERLKNAYQANIKSLKEHKAKLDAHAAALRKEAAALRENADRVDRTVEKLRADALKPTTLHVVTKTDAAVVVVNPTFTVKPAVTLKPAAPSKA